MKNTTNFPPGWDEERVQRLLQHYESLSEDEAVAEDEAAFEDLTQTIMAIPKELTPAVRARTAPSSWTGALTRVHQEGEGND